MVYVWGMTQKQIDALKELGFDCIPDGFYIKKIRTLLFGWVNIRIENGCIMIFMREFVSSHPFTLTKLREIVGKLEKL